MRLALFIFCAGFFVFGFGAKANAQTYYVDCNAANDNGAGTTTGTAWKTIAKVNSSTFLPDDNVLFNRGCTWREQLTVPSSGSNGHPITFGAYGNSGDPKPQIFGSQNPASWDQISTGGSWSDNFDGGSGYLEARAGWSANTRNANTDATANSKLACTSNEIVNSGVLDGVEAFNLVTYNPTSTDYYAQVDTNKTSHSNYNFGPIVRGSLGTSNSR